VISGGFLRKIEEPVDQPEWTPFQQRIRFPKLLFAKQ
jgi:hypothetical protein